MLQFSSHNVVTKLWLICFEVYIHVHVALIALWSHIPFFSARVWPAAKPTWVNGAMLIQQIYTACECGTSEQTMQHLLRCPLLENECSLEDLATANEKALHCARAWPNIWLNSEMMDTKEEEVLSISVLEFIQAWTIPWFRVQSSLPKSNSHNL